MTLAAAGRAADRLRRQQVTAMLDGMRHATEEDLDRLEVLLAGLRALPQLRERKPGNFQRGSGAFVHFHEDAADLYADVKLAGKFERMKVTSRADQDDFLAVVRAALCGAAPG